MMNLSTYKHSIYADKLLLNSICCGIITITVDRKDTAIKMFELLILILEIIKLFIELVNLVDKD